MLNLYNLPTNLLDLNIKKNKTIIGKKIFQNIFLDKKKIGKYPRIIKLKKIGNSQIFEMKNNKKIRHTISEVILK